MKKNQFVILSFCLIFMSGKLLAQDCPDSCEYYIQNTLTPDCDQANCEILEIPSSCPFKTFEFTLYKRWGEIIYQTEDQKMKFDSTGHEDGTYTWKLRGEFCNDQIIDDTGHINIIR